MLADKGYDADWFRSGPQAARHRSLHPIKDQPPDAARLRSDLYRLRHKIENMFGTLKDWRRIHTRYDRCAHTFMSAICIAATVIFWL